MSGVVAKASRLKPNIRLAQAVSQFEAELTAQQKITFRTYRSQPHPPDANDVMRLTAEINIRASGNSGTGRCYGPRMTNFLHAVQQFAAIGDVVVGGSQNLIACGVWTVVRVSLLSIVTYSSYVENISGLLMNIGRSAPRYQSMGMLYPRSKQLQSHLSEYFLVVVRLCHQMFRFVQKSPLARFASSLSDLDLQACQSELELWANTIRAEVDLLTAIRIEDEAGHNDRFRALWSKDSQLAAQSKRLKFRLRVLDLCSTYDHESAWKQLRKLGNATLFNQMDEYNAWKIRPDSCTLILLGKLGCGKSVLLANIVDDLNLGSYKAQQKPTTNPSHLGSVAPQSTAISDTDAIVAYFFCRYDDPESLRARTVLGSLARQLLRGTQEIAKAATLWDDELSMLDSDGVLEILQQCLTQEYKAYVVIDGFDECSNTQRVLLISHLRKLQGKFALRVCVSIRLEPESVLKTTPKEFIDPTMVAFPNSNPDIDAYIDSELERRLEFSELCLGDSALIQDIQLALLEKSQGMFLWVALQIASLCLMKTDDAIRRALLDLPKDLPETFTRILESSKGFGQSYQTRILMLITAAQRPLSAKELCEALSVVPGEDEWKRGLIPNNIYATLTCCGSLVTVDEEDESVRFVHHSVKQFLTDQSHATNGAGFDLSSAQQMTAATIVTYLNYNVFDTRLSKVVVPQIMTARTPSTIIRSTLNTSRGAQLLAIKLLRSRKALDFDAGKTLARASSSFKVDASTEFHFYSYARFYWLHHILLLSELSDVMTTELSRLRKIELTDTYGEREVVLQAIEQAAQNGQHKIIVLLRDMGWTDIDEVGKKGRTPLAWACLGHHTETIKALLSTSPDVDSMDSNGQTPLSLSIGNTLDYEAGTLETPDGRRILVDQVDMLEAEEARKRKPKESMHQGRLKSAPKSLKDVVNLLLDAKANPRTKDNRGRTPIALAHMAGYVDISLKLQNIPSSRLTSRSW